MCTDDSLAGWLRLERITVEAWGYTQAAARRQVEQEGNIPSPCYLGHIRMDNRIGHHHRNGGQARDLVFKSNENGRQPGI